MSGWTLTTTRRRMSGAARAAVAGLTSAVNNIFL
jgi:hypothetical protein